MEFTFLNYNFALKRMVPFGPSPLLKINFILNIIYRNHFKLYASL